MLTLKYVKQIIKDKYKSYKSTAKEMQLHEYVESNLLESPDADIGAKYALATAPEMDEAELISGQTFAVLTPPMFGGNTVGKFSYSVPEEYLTDNNPHIAKEEEQTKVKKSLLIKEPRKIKL